jgi:hypothetical protein
MAEELRVWEVGKDDGLTEIGRTTLDLEQRIEKWTVRDISVLDPGLLVIGEQVPTAFGKYIDLLCINATGDLVIVELKRDKTSREVVAQALDYASWVKDLTAEEIREIANRYLKETDLETAFRDKFNKDLPDVINEGHAMRVVASETDDSTERIIRYLSESYGVDINVVRFQFFQAADGRQLLVRTFTVAPDEADANVNKRPGKRTPPPTSEEMERAAVQAGVGDLYRQCEQALAPYFRRSNHKFARCFKARFPDGSLKTVFSLVPGASNPEKGLLYTVASSRLADFIGLDENAALKQFPPDREPCKYQGAEQDFKGWEGYIKSEDDVRRIAGLLKKARPAAVEHAA